MRPLPRRAPPAPAGQQRRVLGSAAQRVPGDERLAELSGAYSASLATSGSSTGTSSTARTSRRIRQRLEVRGLSRVTGGERAKTWYSTSTATPSKVTSATRSAGRRTCLRTTPAPTLTSAPHRQAGQQVEAARCARRVEQAGLGRQPGQCNISLKGPRIQRSAERRATSSGPSDSSAAPAATRSQSRAGGRRNTASAPAPARPRPHRPCLAELVPSTSRV